MKETHRLYFMAVAADEAYSAAIAAAGFKGRWDMPSDVMRTHDAIREAYAAKVVADEAYSAACAPDAPPPPG